MNNISIRKVQTREVERLQQIAKRSFSETFAQQNTRANMQKYLEKEFSIINLKQELEDPHTEVYFAVADGKINGYLKINFGSSQTEINDDKSLEIHRIYVLKEFQGKKVGQKLYEKAIAVATQKKLDYVWLGVWEKNSRAIEFYKKNGFLAFDKHVFRLGDDEQTDIMMKLEIPK